MKRGRSNEDLDLVSLSKVDKENEVLLNISTVKVIPRKKQKKKASFGSQGRLKTTLARN